MRRRSNLQFFCWIEYAFVIGIFVAIGFDLKFLADNLYLPQPFFFDASDTFTDWFYTAYYSHHGVDAYDYWGTIYPPFSLVFLKYLTSPSLYEASEARFIARYTDWWSYVLMGLFWVGNLIVASLTYWRRDRLTAVPRTIAIAFGLPMLFAVDRGNLVFVTYFFLFLAYGEILHSAIARWLHLAIAVNFKTYLLPLVVSDLLRHNVKRVGIAFSLCVLLYLASWAVYGSGSPDIIYKNTILFSYSQSVNVWDIWYTTTYKPILSLIMGPYPTIDAIGSTKVELAQWLIPLLVLICQLLILTACALSFIWKIPISRHRSALFIFGFVIISVELLGYTTGFLLFLAFMEKGTNLFEKLAILAAYVLALPTDWVINHVPPLLYFGFYAGKVISLDLGVSIGQEIRPALLAAIPTFLAVDTILIALRARGVIRPKMSSVSVSV